MDDHHCHGREVWRQIGSHCTGAAVKSSHLTTNRKQRANWKWQDIKFPKPFVNMPLTGDHVCRWQSLRVYCHSNYYRGLKPVVILFLSLLSAGCEILHTAEKKPRYCMHTLMPSQLMCTLFIHVGIKLRRDQNSLCVAQKQWLIFPQHVIWSQSALWLFSSQHIHIVYIHISSQLELWPGAGEVAQWLRRLIALTENLGTVPSTHVVVCNHP